MKKAKRFALWLVLMLAMTVVFDVFGAFWVTRFGVKTLEDATVGYSMKADFMIEPTPMEKSEKHRTNGLSGLTLRTLIDNDRLDTHKNLSSLLLFGDWNVDESFIFFSEKGSNELSEGIFALVYQDLGEGSDHIKNAVGVVNVKDFIKQECASQVYDILGNNEGATIKVGEYSISNYIVTLSKFSIIDVNGNELRSFECPCDGELIKNDNVYIYDDFNVGGFSVHDKLKTAFLGDRKADKVAKELVPIVDFSQSSQRYNKRSYGFASVTSKHVETTDGYAMVSVLRFSYFRSFILYTAAYGVIMTLIFLLVCRKKDKKAEAYYW